MKVLNSASEFRFYPKLLPSLRCPTTMATNHSKSVFDFTVKDAKGDDVDLATYKGKVLLIWHDQLKLCGVESTIREIQRQRLTLYALGLRYYTYLTSKGRNLVLEFDIVMFYSVKHGLEILAFPCNQFGEEEPGSNDQIQEFVCTRFKSEFPIFDKSGKWGIFGDDIQWNFAKFLIDKDGQVVDRYYPTTSPLSLERDIRKLIEISCTYQIYFGHFQKI
ncbi:putative glutathione peroxidase 8 [Glycine soja]